MLQWAFRQNLINPDIEKFGSPTVTTISSVFEGMVAGSIPCQVVYQDGMHGSLRNILVDASLKTKSLSHTS